MGSWCVAHSQTDIGSHNITTWSHYCFCAASLSHFTAVSVSVLTHFVFVKCRLLFFIYYISFFFATIALSFWMNLKQYILSLTRLMLTLSLRCAIQSLARKAPTKSSWKFAFLTTCRISCSSWKNVIAYLFFFL